MPTSSELATQYKGFLPNLNAEHLPRQKLAADKFFQTFGIKADGGSRMLDVGGGGGFYCKAFSDLGYGEGEYIDLDPVSCEFAKSELKIFSVRQADALQWAQTTHKKFDFIYCRHVVEHLTQPTELIAALIKILAPEGQLIIACPNAESREYLAYFRSRLRQRLRSMDTESRFRRLSILRKLSNGAFLHGIDPPRHVWAITAQGLQAWAQRCSYSCETFSRNLADEAFSPQYVRPGDWLGRLEDTLGQRVLAPLTGGTHLVAAFRQNKPGKTTQC